jgi:hypothetical protein
MSWRLRVAPNGLEQLAARSAQGHNNNSPLLLVPQKDVPQIMAVGGQEATKPLAEPSKANTGQRPGGSAREQSPSVELGAAKGSTHDSGVAPDAQESLGSWIGSYKNHA